MPRSLSGVRRGLPGIAEKAVRSHVFSGRRGHSPGGRSRRQSWPVATHLKIADYRFQGSGKVSFVRLSRPRSLT